MAITVLTDQAITQDTRTLTWTIPTLTTGDVVVVPVITWDTASTQNNPSGTGLAFSTPKVNQSAAGHCRVYIWAMTATAGGSSVVVTSSVLAGGAAFHTGTLLHLPAADGYSLAGSPNVMSANLGANLAAQGTLAGTAGSLGIVAAGDWNGVNGSGRSWLMSATDDMYAQDAGISGQYVAHCTLTGASNTVGLTAPTTGCSNTVGAIEILKSGGGAPALPPIIVMPPRRP